MANVSEPRVEVADDFVLVALKAEIANIGQSPAQRTFIGTKLLSNGSTVEDTAEVAALCEAPSQFPFPAERIVFPGDKPAFIVGAVMTMESIRKREEKSRRAEIDAVRSFVGSDAADRREKTLASEPLHAAFSFLGCVNYLVPGKTGPGQTAFIARVETLCERGNVGQCSFDLSRPARFQGVDASVRIVEVGVFTR